MEYVRVCQVCDSIDTLGDANRCTKCWSFSGLTTVTRREAERLVRGRRVRILRGRLLRLALAGALLIGLTIWGAVHFFGLGPSPPGATTNISASVSPQTWPQGRRTPQNTGFTPDQAPLPEIVKWTYATSAPLIASPAVVDNRVYLTTKNGRVLALDQDTGRLVWEYSSGLPAVSTPAVAGDLVMVPHRPGLVVALHRETGALVWEQDLKGPIFASPVVVDGTLYIGGGGSKLDALDAATGQHQWTFATRDWIISSVAYADGTLVVASQGRLVHILDADTGGQRLVYDTGMSRHGAGPAIQEGLVYFPSDGGLAWAIDGRARSYPFDRFLWWIKTNLYIWQVIPEQPLQKGTLWSKRLGGAIAYTPAVAHDTVYFANAQGTVFAREAAAGQERWTTDLGVEITAAPTVAGETVLIGTAAGTIFGLEARTGEVVWDFKVGDEITASPIVVGNAMYVVSADGKLYAITGVE